MLVASSLKLYSWLLRNCVGCVSGLRVILWLYAGSPLSFLVIAFSIASWYLLALVPYWVKPSVKYIMCACLLSGFIV